MYKLCPKLPKFRQDGFALRRRGETYVSTVETTGKIRDLWS